MTLFQLLKTNLENLIFVTHMRNNALRLSNLEPVELEKSFIKTYFFVNTKAPNFGEGLHPRRYIRSIATQRRS